MIKSFGNKETEDVFHGISSKRSRKFGPDIISKAVRKLDMINAAQSIEDLLVPPGNRLEALKGNLVGYHSIRVNNQWRIIFQWNNDGVHNVTITDYYK